MVIYHYVERIWRILVIPDFSYIIFDHEKYYPGEPVNIHIQSLIDIIQENNKVITIRKGKGKLPLFCGYGERIIPIYGERNTQWGPGGETGEREIGDAGTETGDAPVAGDAGTETGDAQAGGGPRAGAMAGLGAAGWDDGGGSGDRGQGGG